MKNNGFLRFLDPPNSGSLASLGTYDTTFLPYLRLRGILCEFSSYVEKNAFLRFLHLRRVLGFLDPPPPLTLGLWADWEHLTQHFFDFFVCGKFFASSPRTWRKRISAISSLAKISLTFRPPPQHQAFSRLGNIRLKIEEFARQVGGGVDLQFSLCKHRLGGVRSAIFL